MLLISAYLAAVVLANLTVTWFGPSVSILNAFLLIALDLSSRDTLHERWKGRGLWWRMALLIGAGSVLSYLLNADSARIALASFAAFTISSIGDTAAYVWLYKRSYMVKSNGSNVVSAAIDSAVFPALAFGFPLLWGIVIGQFVAKMTGGFIWSVILNRLSSGKTFISDEYIVSFGPEHIEINGKRIRLGTDQFRIVKRDTLRRGYWVK